MLGRKKQVRGLVAVRRLGLLSLLLLAAGALGCGAPVASAIDESDANQAVLLLDEAGMSAQKESDPQAEGKYRVLVAKEDVPRAIMVMREHELPRPKPKGVIESLGGSNLLPSTNAEHAQLVLGTAGELERSLGGLEGVLTARVHLSVPVKEPFGAATTKATASVLIEHRGTTAPLTQDATQRLVAGSVAGLAREDVTVVFVGRPARAAGAGSQLAQMGPLAVARSSLRAMQVLAALCTLLIVGLSGALLAAYLRLAKLRGAAAEEPQAR